MTDTRPYGDLLGFAQPTPGVRYWHAVVIDGWLNVRWACGDPRSAPDYHATRGQRTIPHGDTLCDRPGCQRFEREAGVLRPLPGHPAGCNAAAPLGTCCGWCPPDVSPPAAPG